MLNKDLLFHIIKDYRVEVDEQAYERLNTYAEMLTQANRHINLTAITAPDEMTVKHFADSLSVFNYMEFSKGAKGIDVGTGAGFPGLVMLLVRPDLDMTFLDGTGKKLAFIESVLNATGISGKILHRRAEEAGQAPQYRAQFDFATARAVAELRVLSEYCLPFIKQDGVFISMKSAAAEEEIAGAANALQVLGGKTEGDYVFDLVEKTPRRILVIRKISQTPSNYPRASAKIAKKPL